MNCGLPLGLPDIIGEVLTAWFDTSGPWTELATDLVEQALDRHIPHGWDARSDGGAINVSPA